MDTGSQKNSTSKLDFIVVGQGIAGSVLSLSLIKAGFKIKVIADPSLSSCSKVAAGIWNPVVFKRLTKSWLADDVVPVLNTFYNYLEDLFGITLIHQRNIIKPFTEEQEKNLWLKKAESENLFLDKNTYQNYLLDENTTLASYSKVLKAGSLDVTTFLKQTQLYLLSTQNYIEEAFEHSKLIHSSTDISYNDLQSTNILFCEGHLISKNPYFKWIPMKPAKGEIITIRCQNLNLKNDILNKGIFILPLGDDLYKIGATYEWNDLNDDATEKGKFELLQKLNVIISSPYTVIKHEAGIRPSVTDRRPIVGNHPEFKNIFVFNGFGTKSVMLAPYFAKQFCDSIQGNTIMHSEVNPFRFWKSQKNES